MKLLTTFFLFSIGLMNSFAQTNPNIDRFIEVKITDTIKVAPDYIEAFIKIEEDDLYSDNYSDYAIAAPAVANSIEKSTNKSSSSATSSSSSISSAAAEKMAQDIQEEKGKKEVEKNIAAISSNYKFVERKGSSIWGKDMDMWNGGYIVVLNNLEELERLKKNFSQSKNVTVSIKSMELRNQDMYDARLMEKTMQKSNKEAALIAKNMNVILDKPISIKNYDPSSLNYGDMLGSGNASSNYMGAIWGMLGSMYQNNSNDAFVVLSETLIVRYLYK